MIVASEFRDGNVPAGHRKLAALKAALAGLPAELAFLNSQMARFLTEFRATDKNSCRQCRSFRIGSTAIITVAR